jgi:hypothetical protein
MLARASKSTNREISTVKVANESTINHFYDSSNG